MRRLALVALLAVAAEACRGRPPVPILTWHAVAETGDEFTVPPALLEQQLDALTPYQTLSVKEAMTAPRARAVVLTFDDGTRDALDVVLPALQKRGMHATFFVVTASVGKPGYLDWPALSLLRAAGMEIGSHSVDHARLRDVADAQLRAELVDSRRALQMHLRTPIEVFAYPYNSVGRREKDAARAAGYRWAVAGVVHGSADPYSLYRIPVKRDTTPDELTRALRP